MSAPAPVRLAPAEAAFLAAARVGRLATAGADGAPHLVPVCYAPLLAGDALAALVIALDEKPKRVAPERLRRARNIAANPAVSFLVDRYDDTDWGRLAFLRIDGLAALLGPDDAGHAGALAALRAKYPQYRVMALEGRPVIRVAPTAARSWGALPAAPAGGNAASPPPRALPFDDLVRARRSVRHFRPDPVPRAVVERLIAAAGWAPSPHGRQPWRFAVVTRPETKVALADAMGADWERNLALDGQDAATIAARLAGSRRRVLGAPALIVPCLYTADLDRYPDPARQAAEETMAVQSLGAAVQNLLLAAHDLGLDAGWNCAPLFCPELVRATLGLAPGLVPHALIAVGYAAQDPRRRGRLPLDELIARYE
ncbi:MAG TPA: TIGR03668 family PPOX class F420-dependent oxidoreductase [Thermomicrobiales bacterium]|nr:TIGR03668 family PPOX class F420-dependent oxidoreductase [Thermomicrobiales bacterium]